MNDAAKNDAANENGTGPVRARTARIERSTSESSVLVELDLDGTGRTDISTSVPFYDHMLTALGRHSLIDLTVRATGDTDLERFVLSQNRASEEGGE